MSLLDDLKSQLHGLLDNAEHLFTGVVVHPDEEIQKAIGMATDLNTHLVTLGANPPAPAMPSPEPLPAPTPVVDPPTPPAPPVEAAQPGDNSADQLNAQEAQSNEQSQS